jgi:putative copper export protein
MRNNNAGCLSALLPAFSRIMLLMYWISRPVQMNAAFSTFILPCLGFLFLPFTTLMYVWLIQGVGGIQGIDWLWLILAVLLDFVSVAGAGAANRNRIPAGVPGSTQTPTSPTP